MEASKWFPWCVLLVLAGLAVYIHFNNESRTELSASSPSNNLLPAAAFLNSPLEEPQPLKKQPHEPHECHERLTISPAQEHQVEAIIDKVKSLSITMLSAERMANVRDLAFLVLKNGIVGDFVETGVWLGGASIISRAVAVITNSTDCHHNWLFDSFAGLPPKNDNDIKAEQEGTVKNHPRHEMDPAGSYAIGDNGVERVQGNFKTVFGQGDSTLQNIRFVKGFFVDTVFKAPVKQIAVLRLDGDMYSSTMDVLTAFYDKVTPGGYVIIDDYGWWPQCKLAIHDFFDKGLKMDVASLLKEIDGVGFYFQKPLA